MAPHGTGACVQGKRNKLGGLGSFEQSKGSPPVRHSYPVLKVPSVPPVEAIPNLVWRHVVTAGWPWWRGGFASDPARARLSFNEHARHSSYLSEWFLQPCPCGALSYAFQRGRIVGG